MGGPPRSDLSCWREGRLVGGRRLQRSGDVLQQEQHAFSTDDDVQQWSELRELEGQPVSSGRPRGGRGTRGRAGGPRLDARHGERAAGPLQLNLKKSTHLITDM